MKKENKDDIDKEKFINDYPLRLNIEEIKKIKEQMKKCICKIYVNNQKKGTGFFCIILYKEKKIKGLLTNYHIIGEKKDTIKISLNDDEEFIYIKLDISRKIFTNKSLDVTIIELKENEINEKNFLELDDKLNRDKKNIPLLYNQEPIYILQYPKGDKIYSSFGIIKEIDKENKIIHYCWTEHGSSGSPILSLKTKKVIGIHKGGQIEKICNIGTLFKDVLNEYFSFLNKEKEKEKSNIPTGNNYTINTKFNNNYNKNSMKTTNAKKIYEFDNNKNDNSINRIISKKEISYRPNENNEKWKKISFDGDYEFIKKIGKGAFGNVALVRDKKTKQEYVIKQIIYNNYYSIYLFKNNLKLLSSSPIHTNIIKIYNYKIKGIEFGQFCLYISMEVGIKDWNEEIKERQRKNDYYTEKEILTILKQLTSGFSFLQKQNIAHRDIKPQNIILFQNNVYKIADLGESKNINNTIKQSETLIGSELYMSPLLFNGFINGKDRINHNTFKSDVFSLGYCFLYAMSLNLKILHDIRQKTNIQDIKNSIGKYLFDKYSGDLFDIIYKMIEYKESERYDFLKLEEKLNEIKINK